jgi:hypothetical protein
MSKRIYNERNTSLSETPHNLKRRQLRATRKEAAKAEKLAAAQVNMNQSESVERTSDIDMDGGDEDVIDDGDDDQSPMDSGGDEMADTNSTIGANNTGGEQGGEGYRVAMGGGAAGEQVQIPDQSGNCTGVRNRNSMCDFSPKTKNAYLLADWQANKGKVSDKAMQDLLDVIPDLDTSNLPTWRQVPGLIFAADGYRPPQWREFIVCKSCGVTKDDTLEYSHCPLCTTRDTIADEWVSQGCTIMHLADIVASWFRNPKDAAALLAYLKDPEVQSSMAHSPRATEYFDLLKAQEGIHRKHIYLL